MKELHDKTISELDYVGSAHNYAYTKEDLQQWMIAKINDKIKEHHAHMDCANVEDDIRWKDGRPFGCSVEDDGCVCSICPLIDFLMNAFELVVDDLK
jgi:hypothetical protein